MAIFLAVLAGCVGVGPKPGVDDTFMSRVDADGDGFAEVDDCDDADAAVHPGAVESCDGRDEDCDGGMDEDPSGAPSWFIDADGDGYGDPDTAEVACDAPLATVADGTDCDDADATAHPGGTEMCGGGDEDCDGEVDEDAAADAMTWYSDSDGDGFGDSYTSVGSCDPPDGYVADATDCDDTAAETNPAASEVCGDGDEDCDGELDEDAAADAMTWYSDSDGDGFGDAYASLNACDAPVGYVADSTDCDDTAPEVNPAASEVCGGADENCDGAVDEDSAADAGVWYPDADGDGYGNLASSTTACIAPSGYQTDSTDCDDGDATVNPAAAEVCRNGVDDDCDGTATGCELVSEALNDADLVLLGEAADLMANDSVAAIGDTDADGCSEVLASSASHVARMFGGCSLAGTVPASDALAEFSDVYLVGTGGDVDGDGYADVILNFGGASASASAVDEVGVLLGPLSGALTDADADFVLSSAAHDERPLPGVVGDLDGDGVGDMCMGVEDANGDAGAIYLVYGGLTGSVDLSAADAVFDGEAAGDRAGASFVGAGDTNGDGYADLAIGAPVAGSADGGAVYLIFGPAGSDLNLAAADVIILGDGSGDAVGYRLAAGDADADGYSDLLIPSLANSLGYSGSAWIALGPFSGSAMLSSVGYELTAGPDDGRVRSVATSDVDGDGADELLISTLGTGTRGIVYAFTDLPAGGTTLSTADAVLTGPTGDEAIWLIDPGDVNGDGFGDAMVGAPSSAIAGTDAGAAFVVFGTGL